MNEPITRDTLTELVKLDEQICLSVYMPTHRTVPERSQDPIRYKNLLRELRGKLVEQHPDADHDALLQPFEALLDDRDFWVYLRDGLAVLGGERFFKVFPLQRRAPEIASVDVRPYLKPLLRIAQSADRYQVLCLARDDVRLLEGNRDVLDEVQLIDEVPRNQNAALGSDLTEATQSGHPGGYSSSAERGDPMQHEAGGSGKQAEIDLDRERFFRRVDAAITEHYSNPSSLPLILVALAENQSAFRAVSSNPQLVAHGVEMDPASLDLEELRQRCWKVMSQQYRKRLDGIVDRFGASQGQGMASDSVEDIGQAAVAGRVSTLLVEAERVIPGELDQESGEVHLGGSPEQSGHDVLDQLIPRVLQNGGEVIVVPADQMPVESGAAAVYRF